jgi:hypothetical protein
LYKNSFNFETGKIEIKHKIKKSKMNLAIFLSTMLLTQKGLIYGLWLRTVCIPLHQFEKLIEGILLKRNPKNPTINQGNVPQKKNHQPSLNAMLPTPINKPSPEQYYKRLNIDLSTTQTQTFGNFMKFKKLLSCNQKREC